MLVLYSHPNEICFTFGSEWCIHWFSFPPHPIWWEQVLPKPFGSCSVGGGGVQYKWLRRWVHVQSACAWGMCGTCTSCAGAQRVGGGTREDRQRGCEGEGKGTCAEGRLGARASSADRQYHTSRVIKTRTNAYKPHLPRRCAGTPTGWHTQRSPPGSSLGDSPSQSGLLGETMAEVSPCPARGLCPGAPEPPACSVLLNIFLRETRGALGGTLSPTVLWRWDEGEVLHLSCASSAAARPWLEEPVPLPSLTTANTGFKALPALLYLNPKVGV